jgi:hypothetical protein
VYLWVDGNDENWKKQKEYWHRKIKGEKEIYRDATVTARWRDNDELKYSLRSVEKFAPWINRIYIITGFGQVPKWLNTKNKKITIVSHESIMPPDALPTFNSNAIEMCMGNIQGLSVYFLLSNDDMFFGRPLGPEFFYDNRGRAIIWYTNNHGIRRNFGKWLEIVSGYSQTLALTAKHIRDIFGEDYIKLRPAHNIDPYIKSSFLAARNHPMIIRQIDDQIRNKFRTTCEIQRWFFNLYDHVHGKCVLRRARNFKSPKHFIYNLIHMRRCKNSPVYCTDVNQSRLDRYSPPLFCINDVEYSTDKVRRGNRKFLDSLFPKKSEFEK